VILTDIKCFIPFIQDIIELNRKEERTNTIEAQQLHWEDKNDIERLQQQGITKFDLIVGAEIVYCEDYLDDLVTVLDTFSDDKTQIYLSFKIRLPELTQAFLTKLTDRGFTFTYIPDEVIRTIYPGNKLKIITISKLALTY
jgi:hypothetical protein